MSAGYDEPARTFRGPVITFLVLCAGFAFDAVLGGARAHGWGWLIAAALVVGAHALAVYAANATHGLRLDEHLLRVGEASVPRDDVVGVRPGLDPQGPVLGWETTPKHPRGVTVRLRDGADLGVLTRYPDRLAAALGVGAPAAPAPEPVRLAAPEELPLLAEIDDRSEAVFRVAGYDLPQVDHPLPEPTAVFVVGDPPVAFVWLDEVDGAAYVAEIAVLPGSMRQGIGTRLMAAAEQWAREHGYDAMTLTTYAEVPWNAPWYRSLGYAEWDDPGPGLRAIRAKEIDLGLDAVGPRITMRRPLAT